MVTSALADIRDVVNWLKHIEGRVGSLYTRAAAVCTDDVSFSKFLAELAEEEETHAGFMSAASETLHHAGHRPALDIVLDKETRNDIESLLDRFERLLARTRVSKKDVIEYMARAESSELNPIFLYVSDEYRRASREGERMTGEVQKHLLRIQSFIDDLPRDLRPSVDVGILPFVGEIRFLVLDDNGGLRKLLASLLARRGAVDTATEGHEGLERLREHFHDVIVSDIQMPGMDGLEFYRRAIEYDGHLKGRFLFYSGDIDPEREGYLRENRLRFLRKPFDLHEFTKAIDQILSGEARFRARPNGS